MTLLRPSLLAATLVAATASLLILHTVAGNEDCRQQPTGEVCGAEQHGPRQPLMEQPCPTHVPAISSEVAPPFAAPQAPAESQGAFLAPPQYGTVQGESRGFGIHGLEIELPSLRLRTPTITLPRFFRSRDSARMVMDQQTAPYVANYGPQAAYPMAVAPPAMAPMAAPPLMAPMPAPVMAPAARPPMVPQSPPAAPQAPRCGTDAASLQMLLEAIRQAESQRAPAAQPGESPESRCNSLDQKMSQLREAERRLDSKLQQLDAVLNQLLSLRGSETMSSPEPDSTGSGKPPAMSTPVAAPQPAGLPPAEISRAGFLAPINRLPETVVP